MLGTGLRSGSAMTAKSSWDKSFGVGTTAHGGKVSGDMSYGSNGLAQLDTIKSGDISSLKTTDPAAATSPGASPPALDKEATKAASDAMTDVVKSVAQNAISKGASLLGGGGGGTTPKSSIVADPPPDIKAAGEKTIDQPGGWHCATACDASPDAAHPFVAQDSSIIYSQTSNTKEWVVTYKGEYSIPAAPPATPTPYANYEQSFIVQPDHSLKPMNDGTCVMANGSGNCPELDAVPTGP
jgi:hypothetical protein